MFLQISRLIVITIVNQTIVNVMSYDSIILTLTFLRNISMCSMNVVVIIMVLIMFMMIIVITTVTTYIYIYIHVYVYIYK